MRRSAIITASLFLLLVAVAVSTCGPRSPRNVPGPPQRVILLTVDTLRADRLSCYGYDRLTSPNIDRLAAEGVRFSNAQVPRGSTFPSLTTILTGKYPVTHGVRKNGAFLSADHLTLAEMFSDEGFATGGFFTNMLKAPNRGFDERVPIESTAGRTAAERDREATDRALTWIEEHRDESFFVWLHLYDPHKPYAPEPAFNRFVDPDYEFPIPDEFKERDDSARIVEAEHTELDSYLQYVMGQKVDLTDEQVAYVNALYDGEILAMDHQVGRVLDALEDLGIANDTLLVFTSDHGEELFERNHYFYHANSIYQSVLHVPLIARYPNVIQGGRVVDEVVEAVDVAPTILELTDTIDAVEGLEGESLVPFMNGSRASSTLAYAEWAELTHKKDEDGKKRPIYAIRDGRWKYVFNPDEVHPSLNPLASYKASYFIGKEELYDLATDPGERHNKIDEEPDRAEEFRKQLTAWAEKKEAAGSSAEWTLESIVQLVVLGYYPVEEARQAVLRIGRTVEEFDEALERALEGSEADDKSNDENDRNTEER